MEGGKKNFVSPMKRGFFSGKGDKPEKEKGRPKSEIYERRHLKTFSLVPPDYLINPQVLLDAYIEKEIRFAGLIPEIPSDIDPTMRTDILKIIDQGKKQELIPWYTSHDHDAIFSLSAYNVKISRRNGAEELLLRIAIHDIAAICYIKDDSTHILGLKYGDLELPKETCNLAVLYCDSRTSAEELCSLIGQCFQLVYTDATMQFFDRQLLDGANGISFGSATLRSDYSMSAKMSEQDFLFGKNGQCHAFITESLDDSPSKASRSLPRSTHKFSTTRSLRSDRDSDLSTSATELLHDYMRRLHTKLTADELRQFALLLKAWHTDMPFHQFCQNVLDLYGPDRKHLLSGMRPFIPEGDYGYFESFLERHGVNGNGNGYKTMSSDYSSKYRRTLSDTSYQSTVTVHDNETMNMDEFDRMLSDISAEIETMETSVGVDTLTNLDQYMGSS
ncbi:cerebral cavernous malformations protein 2 homolog [Lineus longissimus]|uniref:cerebral cavernous malformations protein 2 homolog n=1 Tax=Lineus longissimus TaxID=88925 RepID=UPI002B4CCAF1